MSGVGRPCRSTLLPHLKPVYIDIVTPISVPTYLSYKVIQLYGLIGDLRRNSHGVLLLKYPEYKALYLCESEDTGL